MTLRIERLPLPETDEDRARWWQHEKDLLLAGVKNRELVPDRPPDGILVIPAIMPESSSSHIERRHSLFTTWPVKVTVHRYPTILYLRWNEGGETIGLRVWHHDNVVKSEEAIA